MLQRYLLKNAGKYVTVKGKAGRQRPLPLGGWRWVAAAILVSLALRHRGRAALGHRPARASSPTGAKAFASPRC